MRLPAIAVAVALALAGVTLFALEGGDTAVLVTTTAEGGQRRTHVWYAEDDGALWVEAATAERPFYLDLARRPELLVELHRGLLDRSPTVLRARAEPVAEPGGHDRIRALLRQRYGWADAWIALLQDTSASRALRIVADDEPG